MPGDRVPGCSRSSAGLVCRGTPGRACACGLGARLGEVVGVLQEQLWCLPCCSRGSFHATLADIREFKAFMQDHGSLADLGNRPAGQMEALTWGQACHF